VPKAVGETASSARVADFHTYFVGCQEWGFSVWAHNADCWKVADAAEGGFWKVTKPGENARLFATREEAAAFANARNAAAQAAADAAAAAAARQAAEQAAARADLAKTIAGGHAKADHLFGNNRRAFSAAGINTEAKYAQHIDLVMEKGISKQFGRGKTAYYYKDPATGLETVVIHDPRALDKGSAYLASKTYFDGL
jgi:hypothetical protein